MGEYIEPNAAACVSEELPKSSNNGWLDSVSLPLIAGASHQATLALSWALLLFRGTVKSEDGGFSWSDGAESHGCLLVDVILSEDSLLRDVLRIIQDKFESKSEDVQTLLLSNASPGTEVRQFGFIVIC